MTTTHSRLTLVFATMLAIACTRADSAQEAAMPASAPAEAGQGELVAGTPPGGLVDWVAQVEAGLGTLNEQLGHDVQAAQRTALDLYITRQEYIEMYWGAQGRLRGEGTEALSDMVLSAEDAFHDLLQQVAVEPIDASLVRAATDSINARLARVLAEARARGVPLIPPGNPVQAEGGSGL